MSLIEAQHILQCHVFSPPSKNFDLLCRLREFLQFYGVFAALHRFRPSNDGNLVARLPTFFPAMILMFSEVHRYRNDYCNSDNKVQLNQLLSSEASSTYYFVRLSACSLSAYHSSPPTIWNYLPEDLLASSSNHLLNILCRATD